MTKDGTDSVLTDTITYRSPTDTTTTGQVAALRSAAAGYDVTYSYTYDDNGNILTVSDGTNTTSYVYDSANQLTRENNQAAGKTWTWTYDNAGNITSRSEYAYTTGELGDSLDTVTYTYDETWGDLLIGYDGNTITSDTIGNMLSDGTWTYTWEHGRELASLSKDGTTWTYTYNADGLRTKRTDGSTTYSYVYNGSSLSQMTVGTHLLNFAYDPSGTPIAITYDGETYYYVTNLQGDIIAILDSDGEAVVKYTYDAWGKLLTTTGSMATTLGAHNPLRYRGYVYDNEYELYYLQSRYYNPELGRFINADDNAYLGMDGTLLSYNLFAYCKNNPVMGCDPAGHFSWTDVFNAAAIVTITALAVIAIVGSGGAAPPLLAAASAVAGTTVTASAATAVATGAAVVGLATMGFATTASILEASSKNNGNSKQGNEYKGKSVYNKQGERIDFEYNGNGTGNVHYDGTKGKEIIWRLEKGVETTYVVSKAVSKIISTPPVQKAISRAINAVLSLAGLK